MRKKMIILCSLITLHAWAQDSLKTTTLQEVVITGTKFEVPVEKSGKTIYTLDQEDLEKNAGKSLADLLNEVPGVQSNGNFGAPGSNMEYYVRGGRNKHTLILIDGIPLNDPSAINAQYDLRFIPVSQIESVEVLKGGLSTLYGTGATAGVINIKLKEAADEKLAGELDVNAASYGTWSQNMNVSGRAGKFSYLFSGNNIISEGFSSALDVDPAVEFDDDGFSRQNALVKLGYRFTERAALYAHAAYEQFEADYDAYEFNDAPNTQHYDQVRLGVDSKFSLDRSEVAFKLFYNTNERRYESDFPSASQGNNLQAEFIHRHRFSEYIQTLAGINYQYMAYTDEEVVNAGKDFTLVDPYASLLVELPSGVNLHAGARLNTHSVYGNQFVYNINPSLLLNRTGIWRYKILASAATSYTTPSLYQLYSRYGNKNLQPEKALNYEAGFSLYRKELTVNGAWFHRNETDPIDFVSIFDDQGNYIGGQYVNIDGGRIVYGIELDARYNIDKFVSVAANYTYADTDTPESFHRIPKNKYGVTLNLLPVPAASISLKYHYTGSRTVIDFSQYTEIRLKPYHLVDAYAAYNFFKNSLTVYGAVNNVFDEEFVATYGYTTRGRNYSAGVRYSF